MNRREFMKTSCAIAAAPITAEAFCPSGGDDTNEIQNIIDSFTSFPNGGTLKLCRGVYYFSSLNLKAGCHIIGEGNGTLIKGLGGEIIKITGPRASVRKLRLDGQGQSSMGLTHDEKNGWGAFVSQVSIENMLDASAEIRGTTNLYQNVHMFSGAENICRVVDGRGNVLDNCVFQDNQCTGPALKITKGIRADETQSCEVRSPWFEFHSDSLVKTCIEVDTHNVQIIGGYFAVHPNNQVFNEHVLTTQNAKHTVMQLINHRGRGATGIEYRLNGSKGVVLYPSPLTSLLYEDNGVNNSIVDY